MDATSETGGNRRGSRRGCFWVVGIAAGLVVLTVVCVAVALSITLRRDRTAGPTNWDEDYVSGSGDAKVAVLPVEGVIGDEDGGAFRSSGATPEDLTSQLQQADDDPRVKAVILEINSPGGGVVASDAMYQAIQQFKSEAKKPVIVSMGDVAASGGYYISTAADKVVANPATLTGSLGVIFSYLNYGDAARKLGLEEVVIKSGKYKDIGSATRDMTPDERHIFQDLIDETYQQFVDVIVKGRKLPEDRVRRLADGRVYSGKQAKTLGLVDSLGTLDTAARTARELAKVDAATLVRYQHSTSFFDLFTSRLQPGEPQTVEILKATGLDPNPRLQYLYRP